MPALLVMALQVSVALSLNVTDSPAIGAEVAVTPAVAEVTAELLDEVRGDGFGEAALDPVEGLRDTEHGSLLTVVMVAYPSSSQEAAFSAREAQGKE